MILINIFNFYTKSIPVLWFFILFIVLLYGWLLWTARRKKVNQDFLVLWSLFGISFIVFVLLYAYFAVPLDDVRLLVKEQEYKITEVIKCTIDYQNMANTCIDKNYRILENPINDNNTISIKGTTIKKEENTYSNLFTIVPYVITYQDENGEQFDIIVSKDKFDETREIFSCSISAESMSDIKYCFDQMGGK